jgi:predicted nucleic acid-binding protein
MPRKPGVYLIDTDVLSELRKKDRADPGVIAFFARIEAEQTPVYLSVVTIGELRRGIEIIRHRGDKSQAGQLESWLQKILVDYEDCVLAFDADSAQVWGRLRVPHPENALDKQIAATALIHGLTVVTRNERHYQGSGVGVLNPFGSPR